MMPKITIPSGNRTLAIRNMTTPLPQHCQITLLRDTNVLVPCINQSK